MNETATLIRDADGAEVAWEATTGGLSAASTFAFYLTHWADILAADKDGLRMWRRWDSRHTLVGAVQRPIGYRIGYTRRRGVGAGTASSQVRRSGAGGARTRDPGIMSPRARFWLGMADVMADISGSMVVGAA